MNLLKITLPAILFISLSITAFAQETDVNTLVKQGIELNNQKNYTGAIEKYKQALIIDADNVKANYQSAVSLLALGKGMEGVPYLNKVVTTNSNYTEPAYELLGNVYDAANQTQQAVNAYKEAIKLKPEQQVLYYDLGLTYFRANQFADAELAAIEAIKLDPKHAYSHRLYALVTFHQNKRVPALMAFCNFLLISPDDALAGGAYNNIQNLLKGGVLKTETANTDATTITLNKILNSAVAAANQKKNSDPLEAQLKSVFDAVGKLSAQQTNKDFFWSYYADLFYRLSQTDNMPAVAKLVGLSGNKAANTKWLKDNDDKVKGLNVWLAQAEQ